MNKTLKYLEELTEMNGVSEEDLTQEDIRTIISLAFYEGLESVITLSAKIPNDAELGAAVRELYWSNETKSQTL